MQAFADPVEVKMVDSWEQIPGISGQHDQQLNENGEDARAGIQQLEELGYIEPMGPDKAVRTSNARCVRIDTIWRSAILDGQRYREPPACSQSFGRKIRKPFAISTD